MLSSTPNQMSRPCSPVFWEGTAGPFAQTTVELEQASNDGRRVQLQSPLQPQRHKTWRM